jgi:hypothetical protein
VLAPTELELDALADVVLVSEGDAGALGWPATAARRTRCASCPAPAWSSATRRRRQGNVRRGWTRSRSRHRGRSRTRSSTGGTDLSVYDPHGPLPGIEPSEAEMDPSRGTIPIELRNGKLARIAQWREQTGAENLSILQLIRRVSPQHRSFVGMPSQVADEWVHYVRRGPRTVSTSPRTWSPPRWRTSWTSWCRSFRSAARTEPNTRGRRCASTSACPLRADLQATA